MNINTIKRMIMNIVMSTNMLRNKAIVIVTYIKSTGMNIRMPMTMNVCIAMSMNMTTHI